VPLEPGSISVKQFPLPASLGDFVNVAHLFYYDGGAFTFHFQLSWVVSGIECDPPATFPFRSPTAVKMQAGYSGSWVVMIDFSSLATRHLVDELESVGYFLDQRNTWNSKCFGNGVNRSERAIQLQNGSISSLGSGRKPTQSSGGNTGNLGQILSRPPTVLSEVFNLVDIWNQHSIAHTNKNKGNAYQEQVEKVIYFLFYLLLGNICLIFQIVMFASVGPAMPQSTSAESDS
jgi:hypothetical protein